MSRSLAAALCLALAGATLTAFALPRGGCGDAYWVVRGDTLGRIARRCRASVAAIARASGIANPDRIEIGQRLVIPHRRAAVEGAADPGKLPSRPAPASLSYRIGPTDTLYSLARWARVSVPALIAANHGIDPRRIEIGDTVRLPAGAVAPDAARRREGRPGSAPPPRAAPRAAPPEAPDHEEEIKPEDEDEREPMGM